MSERARQHRLLERLWAETDRRCHYCKKPTERYNDIFRGFGVDPVDGLAELSPFQRSYLFQFLATVDHVIPRQDGGPTKWENVVLACFPCNQSRHRKPKKKRRRVT